MFSDYLTERQAWHCIPLLHLLTLYSEKLVVTLKKELSNSVTSDDLGVWRSGSFGESSDIKGKNTFIVGPQFLCSLFASRKNDSSKDVSFPINVVEDCLFLCLTKKVDTNLYMW